MEAKLKIITIGDYKDFILKKSFKDNENIVADQRTFI